jgi:hypothetical protein
VSNFDKQHSWKVIPKRPHSRRRVLRSGTMLQASAFMDLQASSFLLFTFWKIMLMYRNGQPGWTGTDTPGRRRGQKPSQAARGHSSGITDIPML